MEYILHIRTHIRKIMRHTFVWFLIPIYISVWNSINGFFTINTQWLTMTRARRTEKESALREHNARSTYTIAPKQHAVAYSGKKYPLSKKYYEKYLQRVEKTPPQKTPTSVRAGGGGGGGGNTRNSSRTSGSWLLDILDLTENGDADDFDLEFDYDELFGENGSGNGNVSANANNTRPAGKPAQKRNMGGLQIIINTGEGDFGFSPEDLADPNDADPFMGSAKNDEEETPLKKFHRYQQQLSGRESRPRKSEHYEVIRDSGLKFSDIGGYESVKKELSQCIDILKNHTKYSRFNVRVPKGLVFEGPPGTGKTLLAKALAGEADTAFIAVSGSEFQEKYVGVGPMRVRELFALAKNNKPCIVFIDEIDALGRKRSSEGEASSERDNTLNELLVALDGFKNTSGIFVVGATNRIDLLDPALIRPGRIDKRIHIGYPDANTRKAILKIHTRGKPCDISVNIDDLVEITAGMSGAQIENLVNEALLNALRENREYFTNGDIEIIMNKILAGWQPIDHQFNDGIIHQIAIHEMGHSIVGLLSKHHSKMRKVIINLSSPTSPAYTVFEASTTSISTREALFEHLMILLAGRIAEEIFFEASVSTGAINDFEEALKLAERMIIYYGMGKQVIYPSRSEKYKEIIDVEIAELLNSAYGYAEFILKQSKELILEGAEMLKRDKLINANTLVDLMNQKYPEIMELKIQH
jgi:cell division protease FtsH